MRSRILRLVMVALATVTMALGQLGESPASAHDTNPPHIDLPHWPVYRWGGTIPAPGVRAFWISYRGDDPAVWNILGQLKGEWNTYYAGPTGYKVPGFDIVWDAAYKDQCKTGGTWEAPVLHSAPNPTANSYAMLCVAQLGGSTAGLTWAGGGIGNHAAAGTYPFIVMDFLDGRTWEAWKSTLRHELLHLMGLGHSTDSCSLMYPNASGPAACYGTDIIGFDKAPLTEFNSWYNGHPLD